MTDTLRNVAVADEVTDPVAASATGDAQRQDDITQGSTEAAANEQRGRSFSNRIARRPILLLACLAAPLVGFGIMTAVLKLVDWPTQSDTKPVPTTVAPVVAPSFPAPAPVITAPPTSAAPSAAPEPPPSAAPEPPPPSAAPEPPPTPAPPTSAPDLNPQGKHLPDATGRRLALQPAQHNMRRLTGRPRSCGLPPGVDDPCAELGDQRPGNLEVDAGAGERGHTLMNRGAGLLSAVETCRAPARPTQPVIQPVGGEPVPASHTAAGHWSAS